MAWADLAAEERDEQTFDDALAVIEESMTRRDEQCELDAYLGDYDGGQG
jgi:hypothetical protein